MVNKKCPYCNKYIKRTKSGIKYYKRFNGFRVHINYYDWLTKG